MQSKLLTIIITSILKTCLAYFSCMHKQHLSTIQLFNHLLFQFRVLIFKIHRVTFLKGTGLGLKTEVVHTFEFLLCFTMGVKQRKLIVY